MDPLTISLDFFTPPLNGIPKLIVKTVSPDELKTCTCEALRKRYLTNQRSTEPFNLRVLCQSEETLQLAFDRYRDCLEYLGGSIENINNHEYMLGKMVEVCDCYMDGELVLFDSTLVSTPEPEDRDVAPMTPESIKETAVPTKGTESAKCDDAMTDDGASQPQQILLQSPFARRLSRYNELTRRNKTNCKIRDIMQTSQPSLTNKRKTFGYIYIFKSKTIKHQGCVKIGMSTKHPRTRCDNQTKCYPDLQLIAHTNIAIPWARQVERLIGAELASHRKHHDCHQCSKTHTEWFETPIELAEQVVLRWSQWIAKEPYHPINGTLKREWDNRLTDYYTDILEPGVDHIPVSNSWQRWTDCASGGGSGTDHSAKIAIHRLRRDCSPWRKDSGFS